MINKDTCYLQDCIAGMLDMQKSGIMADLILTDPPYGQRWRLPSTTPNNYFGLDCIQNDENCDIIAEALPHMYDVLKPGGELLCFCSGQPDLYYQFYNLIKDCGFKYLNTIVWDKQICALGQNDYYRAQYEYILYYQKPGGDLCFNDKYRLSMGNVISYPRINLNISGSTDDTRRIHPNQKPVPMLRRLIQTHTNVGDLVLDPFAGSNSTAVAAYQEARHYITFEIEPAYYEAGTAILEKIKSQISLFD